LISWKGAQEKKDEEISQVEKDDVEKLRKELETVNNNRKDMPKLMEMNIRL